MRENWSGWSRVNQKPPQVSNELEAAGSQVAVSTVKCFLHQHELRGCYERENALLQTWSPKAGLKIAADLIDKRNLLEETFGGEKVGPITPRTPDLLSNMVVVVLWGCFAVSGSAAL